MFDQFRNTGTTALTVNLNALGCIWCGGIGWLLWPSRPEWWGLGFLSILMWIGAACCLINAAKAFAAMRQREKTIAEFEAIGASLKSAEMASLESLRKAGMIDG